MRISQGDFYKIEGLLTLARKHNDDLKTIQRALCEIVGEDPEEYGFASDAVYEGYSANALLAKLGIEIE